MDDFADLGGFKEFGGDFTRNLGGVSQSSSRYFVSFVDKSALSFTDGNRGLEEMGCSLLVVVHFKSLLGVLHFFPAVSLLLIICFVIAQSIVCAILLGLLSQLLLSLLFSLRV